MLKAVKFLFALVRLIKGINMDHLNIIFDIDGVIVDSENLHFDILKILVPDQIRNFTSTQLIGLSLEETLSAIGVNRSYQKDIISLIIDTYRENLTQKHLRPGVSKLIYTLQKSNIPFGFVSTAPRHICLANLSLLEIKSSINLISGDDLLRTKPFPDPYIEMLNILQADPKKTIVIEDTDLGILAARQAGISNVYAWPHSLSEFQNYSQATAVINSLSDISEFLHLF